MTRKFLTRTLPYTAEDLKAAERWLSESGVGLDVCEEDIHAVTESLAEAFAEHVASQTKRKSRK